MPAPKQELALLVVLALLCACGEVPTSTSVVDFGGERPTTLLVPPAGSKGPRAPLLVVLHDYGSSGALALEATDLADVALSEGLFVLAPDGLIDSQGSRFWNGGACCDFDESGVDDATYVVSLIEEVGSQWPVDRDQVAVVGFGAGGFLSYELGCRFGAKIATIVSIGGAAPENDEACEASPASRAVHIHGDQDEFVSYAGTNEQPGALGSAALFAKRNGCLPLPVLIDRLNLDHDVAGRETRVAEFPGCGGRAQLWTLQGSAHMPDPTPSFAPRVIGEL